MMTITIQQQDGAFHLRSTNEHGLHVDTDHSSATDDPKGMSPMEMVLAALGSCSGIDVVALLQKQRQLLEDMTITVDASRQTGTPPNLFDTIHLTYHLYGDLDDTKVERAVRLSMEKLCSVAMIVRETATIKWSYEIHAGQAA